MKYHLALSTGEGHIAFSCRNHTHLDKSLLSAEDENTKKIKEITGVPNADKNMSTC